VPPHSFNSNVRCLAYKGTVLMIGALHSFYLVLYSIICGIDVNM